MSKPPPYYDHRVSLDCEALVVLFDVAYLHPALEFGIKSLTNIMLPFLKNHAQNLQIDFLGEKHFSILHDGVKLKGKLYHDINYPVHCLFTLHNSHDTDVEAEFFMKVYSSVLQYMHLHGLSCNYGTINYT